jgi:hypothetical protein
MALKFRRGKDAHWDGRRVIINHSKMLRSRHSFALTASWWSPRSGWLRVALVPIVALVISIKLVSAATATEPEGTTLDEPDWDGGIIRDEVIPPAKAGTAYASWLEGLREWRTAQKAQMKYDDALYRRPELLWAQRDFIQTQMMVEDRYFYDPATRHYTVDRYLDDLKARYGGIDSVLIWPVYPNMGIDNRSQHDLLRDMPGGNDGVRQMIADFHRRGVHVLFPMNPWDTGTREEGPPLPLAIAKNFKSAGSTALMATP